MAMSVPSASPICKTSAAVCGLALADHGDAAVRQIIRDSLHQGPIPTWPRPRCAAGRALERIDHILNTAVTEYSAARLIQQGQDALAAGQRGDRNTAQGESGEPVRRQMIERRPERAQRLVHRRAEKALRLSG
jgi:hypothetical protein